MLVKNVCCHHQITKPHQRKILQPKNRIIADTECALLVSNCAVCPQVFRFATIVLAIPSNAETQTARHWLRESLLRYGKRTPGVEQLLRWLSADKDVLISTCLVGPSTAIAVLLGKQNSTDLLVMAAPRLAIMMGFGDNVDWSKSASSAPAAPANAQQQQDVEEVCTVLRVAESLVTEIKGTGGKCLDTCCLVHPFAMAPL